jgi:hypothetical protein
MGAAGVDGNLPRSHVSETLLWNRPMPRQAFSPFHRRENLHCRNTEGNISPANRAMRQHRTNVMGTAPIPRLLTNAARILMVRPSLDKARWIARVRDRTTCELLGRLTRPDPPQEVELGTRGESPPNLTDPPSAQRHYPGTPGLAESLGVAPPRPPPHPLPRAQGSSYRRSKRGRSSSASVAGDSATPSASRPSGSLAFRSSLRISRSILAVFQRPYRQTQSFWRRTRVWCRICLRSSGDNRFIRALRTNRAVRRIDSSESVRLPKAEP